MHTKFENHYSGTIKYKLLGLTSDFLIEVNLECGPRFYSNKFPGDVAASGGLDTGPETSKYNCERLRIRIFALAELFL